MTLSYSVFIYELIDVCTIQIYLQKFFNSNMLELFLTFSNVKADGQIAECPLNNWLQKFFKNFNQRSHNM